MLNFPGSCAVYVHNLPGFFVSECWCERNFSIVLLSCYFVFLACIANDKEFFDFLLNTGVSKMNTNGVEESSYLSMLNCFMIPMKEVGANQLRNPIFPEKVVSLFPLTMTLTS